MIPNGGQNQMRSQSQDKSKLAFKARLDQKATQLAQDDSNIPNNGAGGLMQKNPITIKNQVNQKKTNLKNGTANLPVKLPRTGIDQPFIKERPRFREVCREFEPIHQFNTTMCDEYARIDAEKLLNNQSVQSEKIVYDCIDYPPIKKDATD